MLKIKNMKNNNIVPIPCKSLWSKVKIFTLLWLSVGIHPLTAAVYAQDEKVNLTFKNAGLKEILNEIKSQTQYDFVYSPNEVNADHKVSLNLRNADLKDALKICLEGLGIDYIIDDKIIILQKQKTERETTKQQQEKLVKGKVTDRKGNPLPGVTVSIQGTTIGNATDKEGTFSLRVPDTQDLELIFSFVGMKTQVHRVKGDQEIHIVMEDEISALEEVVVTGMEVIKKDRMTGSAKVITAKDLKTQGLTSIDQILEGMVSGLNSTTLSGAPGTRAKITIRGENNLSGHTEPLWIVDGLPLLTGVPENNTGDYAGTIMQDGVGNIMPEDIESITILKDASAAAIYGAKAANGVIVVTTKKGFRSKTRFNYSGSYNIAVAPAMRMDFMNAEEKLQYETAIMDNFGLASAHKAGRGGRLYKQMYEGYITPAAYRAELKRLGNVDTDWFKTLFRTAHSQSHSLSLRGGSEEMTYYTSVNFQQKNGILRPNTYSNAGALIKLDYRPVKNLILALDISANVRKNRDQASAVNPFNYAVFANPYEQPYDENGNYAADLSYLGGNYTESTPSGYKYTDFNIMREMEETRLSQDGLDVSLTFDARYEVVKGLTLESIIRKGVSYNTETTEIGQDTYTSYAKEAFARKAYPGQDVMSSEYNNGELSESSGKNFNWSIRNQIDYSFHIRNNHLFSVLVANEVTSKKFNNFGYTSPIYFSDYRITGIPAFEKEVSYKDMRDVIAGMFNTSDGQDRTVSFLASLRYGYKDRYVINFNYRADGADAIGETNRFTPLWSLGLRYNLHKEKFFKNDIVSELSLRGSYGYTGNIDRTAYPFSTISFGTNTYEGNRYVTEFNYPNPSVKWERKLDRNLGIDASFFRNRVNVTVDYYSNRTEDVLEDLTIPYSTGRNSVRANGGIVENKGLEFYLNVRWVNDKDFTFSTSVNFSRNKNVIKRSQHTYDSYADAIKSKVSKGGIINVIGKETGAIYGWKVAGVNPLTGNPQYYLTDEGKRAYAAFLDAWDTNSQSMKDYYRNNGIVTSLDRIPEYVDYIRDDNRSYSFMMPSMQYLGRSNPLYVGGFNTYFRYKNIEFSTQWTFKTGHIIPSFDDLKNAPNNGNGAAAGYSSDLDVSGTNRLRKYLAFWQAPGDVTDIPRFVTSGNDYWATLYTSDDYEKGDYLRMTNLSLSYRLPSELVQRFGMNNMSLSFNARNLLTFTKYRGLDVGSGGAFTYPVSREFNLKLSVGF